MFITFTIIIALFFAVNIGASGTAASMGAAYGAGAIKKRWVALILVSIVVFLGAFFGGGEVVNTIGEGIVPSQILSVHIAAIILSSACLTLFFANILGVPLSTSEVTVGAVVGVGIAYKSLFIGKILLIVSIWILLPVIAFCITYAVGKRIPRIEKKLLSIPRQPMITKILIIILIVVGCYEAFAAGMNNVANAFGPLVGAGLLNTQSAILWGGLFVAFGALTLGGKVLETNAKKITDLSLLQGITVSFTSGTLVVVASIFGIPVPLTQATTASIFGIGSAQRGRQMWRSSIVQKIIKVWIISPVSSMVVSYLLVETIIENNIYASLIIIGAFLITIGLKNLAKLKQDKISAHH